MSSQSIIPRADSLSCFIFFAASGAYYALFTSRLPAVKATAGVTDAEIGFGLLVLGVASVTGLLSCGALIRRFTSRRLLQVSVLGLLAAFPLAGVAPGALSLYAVMAWLGLMVAIWDVCMNTQALLLEIRTKGRYMGKMQAGYSFGCIGGALLGSAFAKAGVGAFANYLFFAVTVFALWLFASRHLHDDITRHPGGGRRPRLPAFVWFCGLMEVFAFTTEGVVGDWGAIFLHSEKGAEEGLAALGFATCATAMAFVRLTVDNLRGKIGDTRLVGLGGLVAAAGFVVAILASSPYAVLFGFALVGAGVAPVIPVVMSRAGSCPGVDPGAACSAVSTVGYGTLLVIPPVIGTMADAVGFSAAFLVPLAAGILIVIGSLGLRTRKI